MAQTAKIVRFHQTGGPDRLQIEDLPLEEPGPGEVRLRVRAIGLNRAEVAFREGKYLVAPRLPSKLGYEASGVVEAVGEGVDPSWLGKTASTVPAFPANLYGVYGEAAIVPVGALAEYPPSLSFEEGTSIWMQYITAWGALMHIGGMRAGDAVLITAPSSSVGIAAIEMARAEGAVAIAATRTREKRDVLLEAGAHHVIVTGEEDVVARTMEITGGKGARLIFDPVGGPMLEQLAAAAAFQGIVIEYGRLDSRPSSLPGYALLSKSLTIRGYTLFELMPEEALRQQAERYVYDHIVSGAFKPRIDRVFGSLDEIAEAHRYMQSNQQIGKIVVRV